MTYTLIPKLWYTITPETDCDVATPNGISIHLPAGIQYFHFADSVSIDISGTATVTQNPPLFKPASASALGGGYIESNLNVGHGAADAVAAQCTLTLGDLASGGALADSNGQRVELEAPHKYAEGSAAFRDAAEACMLTIGEWSKVWEAAPGTRATGWLQLAAGMGTFMVNGLIVCNPEDYTDVEAWNDVLEPCGVYCTDESIESGSPKVNIAAIEYGEAGNAITLEAVGEFYSVSGPTLAGGANGRTAVDVFNDIHNDENCPVDVTLDADEQGLGFTAKEYGVNDTISAVGDMFSNWTGMSGGHGDYTVAELITAISGEFDDIAPTAGATEGTITLTANTAGAAANAIEYTAAGCFGSGTVKQGSTTRGKNAVAQTEFKIYLNGAELDVEPAPQPTALTPTTAMRNGGVYTVAADIDAKAISLPANATAEIMVTNDAYPVSVQWPDSWYWLDGTSSAEAAQGERDVPPQMDVFCTRYCVEVRHDGNRVVARLKYSAPLDGWEVYDLPNDFIQTLASEMADLPDPVSAYASWETSGSKCSVSKVGGLIVFGTSENEFSSNINHNNRRSAKIPPRGADSANMVLEVWLMDGTARMRVQISYTGAGATVLTGYAAEESDDWDVKGDFLTLDDAHKVGTSHYFDTGALVGSAVFESSNWWQSNPGYKCVRVALFRGQS